MLQLGRVRFVGEMFIGLGENGTLATSVDGKTWVTRSTGTSAGLRGVALGMVPARLFITVGHGGTILKSSDGTNWSRVITANTCNLNDVAWNGIFFEAVATRANIGQPNALRSYDGVNWYPDNFSASSTPSGGSYYTSRIIPVGSAFVATGGIYITGDIWRMNEVLWTWSDAGISDQVVAGIANSGNRLVMVGWEGWPRVSVNQGASWFAVAATNIWSVCPPPIICAPMIGSDIAFGNGTFLVVRSFLRNGMLTTPDGLAWSSRSALSGLTMDSVAFGNGTFVAVGADGIYQSEPVATPVLSTTYASDSSALQLLISGEIGRAYRLQTSSLSSAWTDRWAYTNTAGTTTFVDPIRPITSLFYRVISP